MKLTGCFVSADKIDKILVTSDIGPDKLQVHMLDQTHKSLARVWLQILEGRLILYVQYVARLEEPVHSFLIATL